MTGKEEIVNEFVTLEHIGPASVVTLNRPPFNLLNLDVLNALVDAHVQADAHPQTRVIVTKSAVPQVFSLGLDPAYVIATPPEQRGEIFLGVGRLLHRLFALKKPHVTVIPGPAMAGGAILAIGSDVRVMERHAGRLSFSEPKVGLPIPRALQAVIAHFCNPAQFREVVWGKNMTADEAHQAGLADVLTDADGLEAATQKQVERFARLSPLVLAATKRAMREKILELTEPFMDGDAEFSQFVGEEFLGEGLRALVEKRAPRFGR